MTREAETAALHVLEEGMMEGMLGRPTDRRRRGAPAREHSRWHSAFSGRETDTYFGRAIVDARPTFNLTYRLGIRLAQFVAFAGAAGPGAGIWRPALPAFCLLDIVIWLLLKRSEKFALPLRLAVDTFDMVFWSLSPVPVRGDFGIAVQIGTPLTVEAGFRIGPWAFVVPAVEIVATATARSLAGRSVPPVPFISLLIGVVMGMALFAYCRHLYQQSEIERSLRLSADKRRAFLAGQNEVAMGASSVVDAIEGLVPILGRPPPGSALWELADGWKTRLGRSTAREATYLQVALLEWARDHNRHPDLASRVELFFDEGIGTTLLTGNQVSCLRDAFEQRNLRGAVRVSLVGTGGILRTPGSVLVLRVGPEQIVVPADVQRTLRPLDGSVVGYLLVATIIPLSMPTTGADLPWTAALAGIGLCLGVGWWCHRRLMTFGPAARRTNAHGAIFTALAITVLLNLTIRRSISTTGDANIVNVGLPLLALILGAYWRDSTRAVIEIVAAVFATCGVSLLLFPGTVTLRGVILMLDWGFFLFFPVWLHIGLSLDGAQKEYAAVAVRDDADSVMDAFRRGQEEVVSLVRRARDDAQQQLDALLPRLPAPYVALAHTRLEDVDLRLQVIGTS